MGNKLSSITKVNNTTLILYIGHDDTTTKIVEHWMWEESFFLVMHAKNNDNIRSKSNYIHTK